MTGLDPPGMTVLVRMVAGAGLWSSVARTGAGVSASTSAAGLSSRRPLNEAWRMEPSPVKPAYWISATSSGRTQWTPAAFFGAPLPLNGLTSVSSAVSRGMICATTSRPKPVPMRPTCTSAPSRFTPAISERKASPVVVQPPITTSCPWRHLDLPQLSLRPD